MSDQYPTQLGAEHKTAESQDLDKAYEQSSDRAASDAGKAHSYANAKLSGAGEQAAKDGPDPNAERGNNAGSGPTKRGDGPAPAVV